jgi:hypothetical protein
MTHPHTARAQVVSGLSDKVARLVESYDLVCEIAETRVLDAQTEGRQRVCGTGLTPGQICARTVPRLHRGWARP